MDLAALILAIIALVVFLMTAFKHWSSPTIEPLALGLALLTASWICQATTITDHLVDW